MGDPTNMPPLSGEIMAGDSRRGIDAAAGAAELAAGAGSDVVDADFVTLPRPASDGPGSAAASSAGPRASAPQAGLEMLIPKRPTYGSQRASAGFWAAGGLAAAAAFWMSGGHALSRYIPLAGGDGGTLRIAGLTSRIAATATGPNLFIDGEVRNTAVERAASPDLLIDVTAQDGLITRYRLATGAGHMASGESRRFSSRLAAPDSGVRSVSVAIDREGRD